MVEPLLTSRPLHVAGVRVDHRLGPADLAPEHPDRTSTIPNRPTGSAADQPGPSCRHRTSAAVISAVSTSVRDSSTCPR